MSLAYVRPPPRPLPLHPVITSYSIHYTKLYDGVSAPARSTPVNTEVDFNDPELDERQRLIAALEKCGWVQAKAARLLGMTPRQIAYRIQIMNINMRRM